MAQSLMLTFNLRENTSAKCVGKKICIASSCLLIFVRRLVYRETRGVAVMNLMSHLVTTTNFLECLILQ